LHLNRQLKKRREGKGRRETIEEGEKKEGKRREGKGRKGE
jgi:hypothetical protein